MADMTIRLVTTWPRSSFRQDICVVIVKILDRGHPCMELIPDTGGEDDQCNLYSSLVIIRIFILECLTFLDSLKSCFNTF